MVKYFTLAATIAVSASAFSSYEEYVADDVKPVCAKHFEDNRNRLCNLFLSCHYNKFQSGITGQKWCPQACAKFQECFPREMCKADHWMQQVTDKFELDEDNNQVCYTKNRAVGRQCVPVMGFCDMGPVQQIAPDVCTGGLSFIHDINRPHMVWDIRGGLNLRSDLIFWSKHGGSNQQFRFEKLDNGYFRVKTANNSWCLGVETTDASAVMGKRNRLMQCSDAQNQQYIITINDAGNYQVASSMDAEAFVTTTGGIDSYMKAAGTGGQEFTMACV